MASRIDRIKDNIYRSPLEGNAGQQYSLAINPDFAAPNFIDRFRGVDYPDAEENGQAQQAMVARVLEELVPAKVGPWIAEAGRRRGGLPELARALVAMKPNPSAKPSKKGSARQSDEAAMLRALQRSAPAQKGDRQQSHGTIRKLLYRQRIGLMELRTRQFFVIGIRGWWQFSQEYKFTIFHTDPADRSKVVDMFAQDGAGLMAFVAQEVHEGNRGDLDKSHELQAQVGNA